MEDIHPYTGSTGQTYMWKDKDKHTKKCFSHRSNKLYRKSKKTKWGETGRKKEDAVRGCGWVVEKAAVSGQVISVVNQQPPQLFPQLGPSDAHWPLCAATPQRENWSRHRSAKHAETVKMSQYTNAQKTQMQSTVNAPLSSSSCAHTVLTQTSLLMTYTRRKLNGNICRDYKRVIFTSVKTLLKE